MIECGDSLNYATIGNLIMQRDDGEPVPAFRERARETALGLGAAFLLFDNYRVALHRRSSRR